jgi:very-short-patch-repair endonuclease
MQGVDASLPERIVWAWLERENYIYWRQEIFFGGRGFVGGAVVDFIVLGLAGQIVALRVQGSFWHGPLHPDRQALDDEQAARLRADGYLVVDLWEDEIYNAYTHGWLTEYILSKVP